MPNHSHKCPDRLCNRIWHHNDNDLRHDEADYDTAHKCPDCGTVQRQRYFADKFEEAIFVLEKRIEYIREMQAMDKRMQSGEKINTFELLELMLKSRYV